MTNELAKKYGFENEIAAHQTTALAEAQANKSVQEIQSALVIAKKFPRNEMQALMKILKSCERPFLAEQAMYAYPRGGQMVTGPSIRMAEVLAQNWGNISFGIREISQSNGVSEVEAFAWDLETNTQQTKIFSVPHIRYTKKGTQKLTDPRDIYEMVANQGARRLRACILGVIPGDIVDAALDQIQKTLSTGEEPITDRIRKLAKAFNEFGVSVEMIEKRLGHNLDATIDQEIVSLRAIYKSLKDGMADRTQFFDFGETKQQQSAKDTVNNLICSKENAKTQQDANKKADAEVYAKAKG